MRHLLAIADLSRDDLEALFEVTAELKGAWAEGRREPLLRGKALALLFEKPSLRTRASFEAAMAHLGGSTMFLDARDVGLGTRETVPDFARVLGCYADCIAMRTFSQALVEELARHAGRPVINALSDHAHPCQALADLFTLREAFGDLAGRTLAFVGDGNNVARSLAAGCGLLDMRFLLAAPRAYQLQPAYLGELARRIPGFEVEQTEDPVHAVAAADAVYTDVWASMGQEAEADKRRRDFASFQVNATLMAAAPPGARFLHCLPAHRGEEVTDDVLDGPASLALQQAENRMHVSKGLLVWLLE